MGWCGGTDVFDAMAEYFLTQPKMPTMSLITALEVLTVLVNSLEDQDWDCQQDSRYYGHPVVRQVMREIHPDWFEEEEE